MGAELVVGLWMALAAALGLTQGEENVVVLLPEEDGRPSAIVVVTDGGEQEVSTPYSGVVVTTRDAAPSGPKTFERAKLEKDFADVLAARPAPPKSYQFYFETGSNTISDDQRGLLEALLADVKARTYPSVTVIGHTDRVGRDDVNYRLALRRAEAIRTFLVGQGVSADVVEYSSHGEKDPLVATGDNVPEPRNRRVEVLVK